MRYWVFHEEMLARALAEHEARRVADGASPEQARDESADILRFLTSHEAAPLVGGSS